MFVDDVIDVDVRAGVKSAVPLLLEDSKSRRRAFHPGALPGGNQMSRAREGKEGGAGEAFVNETVLLAAARIQERRISAVFTLTSHAFVKWRQKNRQPES